MVATGRRSNPRRIDNQHRLTLFGDTSAYLIAQTFARTLTLRAETMGKLSRHLSVIKIL